MPFDGSNYGSEVLRLLRRAYGRIVRGQWVQGRLITREPGDVYHYCMMGSIVCNDDGVEDRNDHTNAAIMVVGQALGFNSRLRGRVEAEVIRRNDAGMTSRYEVERIMHRAVRLQELEEFGTSVPSK